MKQADCIPKKVMTLADLAQNKSYQTKITLTAVATNYRRFVLCNHHVIYFQFFKNISTITENFRKTIEQQI